MGTTIAALPAKSIDDKLIPQTGGRDDRTPPPTRPTAFGDYGNDNPYSIVWQSPEAKVTEQAINPHSIGAYASSAVVKVKGFELYRN